MNLKGIKHNHLLNRMKQGEDGSLKPLSLSSIKVDSNNTTKDFCESQLKEMEMLNTHLSDIIEERTKKMAEIVNSNRKFISILAHDLRSPFNSVLSLLMLLKENLQNPDRNTIEDCIEDISNSTMGTLKLLDNLLEWAILQNMGKTFNPVKINLHELLNEEKINHNYFLKLKQLTLNHFVTPRLHIAADLCMTKSIFRNLINNAIKFSNPGGEITISASESKRFVEIAVKDTGIGISTEAQKKLFKIDTFHSTTGTNNEKGTGLGLLLCKEFVEMHGGNIRIESEPGFGSEFKFTLPHYI